MATAFELLGLDPNDIEVIEANEDFDELADFIRMLVKLRKEKGVKQREIAARMGTKQSVVSDLERVAGNPTIRSLQRYVRALDCQLGLRVRAHDGWRDATSFRASTSRQVSTTSPRLRPVMDTAGGWALAA